MDFSKFFSIFNLGRTCTHCSLLADDVLKV